jgi:carotene epsilon-monooxygenase
MSWVSPNWLTSIMRVVGKGKDDESGIPIAAAKLEDVQDLLGGALFLPLFKWMMEEGPVYRLSAGPRNFVIVGDPAVAKHVLKNYGKTYAKGLVAEVAEFLFGSGFAIAEGQLWTIRRRAVVPSLHRKYLSTMVDRVFCRCSERLIQKLEKALKAGEAVNMEAQFSQLTLDVIGLSVFNYDFDSLTSDSPVIEAVYTALKETESRSTDILPYWQVPLFCKIVPRQRKAAKAVAIIRETVERLVAECKQMVEAEKETLQGDEYVNESDPSVLRFLLASREEVSPSL